MLKKSVILFCLVLFIPTANAEYFNALMAQTWETNGVVGVVSAGDYVVVINYPQEVSAIGNKVQVSVQSFQTQPLISSAGLTGAYSFNGVGCTGTNRTRAAASSPLMGTFEPQVYRNGFSANDITGTSTQGYNWNIELTMTANQCSGVFGVVACISSMGGSPPPCDTILVNAEFPIFIHTRYSEVNNQNRLCGNSTFDEECTLQQTFDWEAFAVKYLPAILAITLAAVFFRRRDPIFGVIAIALLLYTAFAFPWSNVIITIAMMLVLYIIVAILILRKQEKGLQVA